MGVDNYGVLRGRLLETGREDDLDSPHFQIIVGAVGRRWRVPVNVRSQDGSDVLYKVVDPFAGHGLLDRLPELAEGFTPLPERRAGLTLDYVRDSLARCPEMRALPHTAPGEGNDLQDILELHVRRLERDPQAEVFAWGAMFSVDPNAPKDADRKFRTTHGVHDIHMNQGNPPQPVRFFRDNGIHQDGGLVLRFPSTQTHVALFLSFQTQAFDTDDQGRPQPGAVACHAPGGPGGGGDSEGDLRIVAALINPPGHDPGGETLTLINRGVAALSLSGWALEDRNARREVLSGTLGAGETLRVRLTGQGVQLGNQGGVVTLIDPRGARAHSVAYSPAQAAKEGRTHVFGA